MFYGRIYGYVRNYVYNSLIYRIFILCQQICNIVYVR